MSAYPAPFATIQGDAFGLEGIRSVSTCYDKAWWRPTRWFVEVDYFDNAHLEWQFKTETEANDARDGVIKALRVVT